MDIHDKLAEIDLSPSNSVVIGSGILNALRIRPSKDIDIVVPQLEFDRLSLDPFFNTSEHHGKKILNYALFEIVMVWPLAGKNWHFSDLLGESIVIDSVRYNTLDFLLRAKQSWVEDGTARPKDLDDIALIKEYLESKH